MYASGQIAYMLFGRHFLQCASVRCEMRLHTRLLQTKSVRLNAGEHLVAVVDVVMSLLYHFGGHCKQGSVIAQLVVREPSELLLFHLRLR